jgi:hypothetical protein
MQNLIHEQSELNHINLQTRITSRKASFSFRSHKSKHLRRTNAIDCRLQKTPNSSKIITQIVEVKLNKGKLYHQTQINPIGKDKTRMQQNVR